MSRNDLDTLSKALRRMETVTLTRTLGDTEVTASVVPAGKAWPVAMLVQVRVRQGRTEWVQHFESVEEAERSIEQKQIPMVGVH